MSYLDQLINELCPDGVEYEELRNACLPVRTISWGNCSHQTYKYIDLTSVDRINHSIGDTQNINKENAPSRAQQVVKENDVIFGTTRPTLKRYCSIPSEYDGHICSTGFCVIRANSSTVLPRFIYHIISTVGFQNYVELNQKGSAYPSISNSDVLSYVIPLPPLPVQEEIVRILDKFTALEAELEAELEARKKQYEYYSRKLIDSIPSATYMKLRELGNWYGGGTPSTQNNAFWNNGTIPWVSSKDMIGTVIHRTQDHITPEAIEGSSAKMMPANSVAVVVRSGILRHTLPIVFIPFATAINQDIKALDAKAGISSRYVAYALRANHDEILNSTRKAGGTVESLLWQSFLDYSIPVPALAEQSRIVSILDRFDALVNDITQGLPAELAARRRQYEYYRDKLLTFKEKAS